MESYLFWWILIYQYAESDPSNPEQRENLILCEFLDLTTGLEFFIYRKCKLSTMIDDFIALDIFEFGEKSLLERGQFLVFCCASFEWTANAEVES